MPSQFLHRLRATPPRGIEFGSLARDAADDRGRDDPGDPHAAVADELPAARRRRAAHRASPLGRAVHAPLDRPAADVPRAPGAPCGGDRRRRRLRLLHRRAGQVHHRGQQLLLPAGRRADLPDLHRAVHALAGDAAARPARARPTTWRTRSTCSGTRRGGELDEAGRRQALALLARADPADPLVAQLRSLFEASTRVRSRRPGPPRRAVAARAGWRAGSPPGRASRPASRGCSRSGRCCRSSACSSWCSRASARARRRAPGLRRPTASAISRS